MEWDTTVVRKIIMCNVSSMKQIKAFCVRLFEVTLVCNELAPHLCLTYFSDSMVQYF